MPCWFISIVCNVGNFPSTRFTEIQHLCNCNTGITPLHYKLNLFWLNPLGRLLRAPYCSKTLSGKILFALGSLQCFLQKALNVMPPSCASFCRIHSKYEHSKYLNLLSKCRKLSSTLMVYILCVKCKYLTASTALYLKC